MLTYILILFFQLLFSDSKPITLFYVTHYVTTVTYLFIVQEIKLKEKKRKRKIKLKKIDKITILIEVEGKRYITRFIEQMRAR